MLVLISISISTSKRAQKHVGSNINQLYIFSSRSQLHTIHPPHLPRSQLSRQEDNSARYGSGEGSGGYGFGGYGGYGSGEGYGRYGFGGYGSGGYGWIRIALGCCCRRIFSWLFQSLQYFHFLFTFLVFALKQTNFQPNMREKNIFSNNIWSSQWMFIKK